MKIGIQTWGSNGDIRPMLALADGLQKAGHSVMLVVSSIDNRRYVEICEQLGISYRQVPEHIDFDMEGFAQRSFRMNPLQWLRALLDEAFFPYEPTIYQAARQLAADNDILIGHHFLYPLKLAALQQKKPFFSITLCHAAIPNPAVAPFSFPDLGEHINKLSWRLLDIIFNWILKKPLTRLWLEAGQKPPANVLSELLTSQQLDLVAVDPWFCPSFGNVEAHHQVCGFLNLSENAEHWIMSSELAEFLANGDEPVYMTFGSLQQAVPDWSMELFLQAAALSGCRAIIQTSSERYPADSQSGQVYFIGRHPHQPLFKHCAAVVHHGGAGTTHAATRTGCPSVVVPFMDEQLFWARQLQALGLAGKPLPAKKVTAVDLAKGIRTVLDSQSIRHNAQQASLAMQTQNGVSRAIQLIEARF
ncbi:glycosyltransferase [Candidatus Methylobacter oryzae]|uniref:Glycosyltransferase family 1 protein n=1 Tax=Candidatus Methylobacter oryzae TaxID=2497749 RepID=A0ABY3CGT3_9GAMM|nr:glycosyltransferase [Candidatus Methylobacter oryzae]TRX02921.1 glycosyltransferase family 1 protein [Candidatus Methylobacter oryzae]